MRVGKIPRDISKGVLLSYWARSSQRSRSRVFKVALRVEGLRVGRPSDLEGELKVAFKVEGLGVERPAFQLAVCLP